jgi:hypothetical protein
MDYVRLQKIIFRTHLLIGLYGFTRGYRSIPYEVKYDTTGKRVTVYNNNVLVTQKITNGVMNGFMYCMPMWNIPMVMNGMNRVEIKVRGLEADKYLSSYQEWSGMCYTTL